MTNCTSVQVETQPEEHPVIADLGQVWQPLLDTAVIRHLVLLFVVSVSSVGVGVRLSASMHSHQHEMYDESWLLLAWHLGLKILVEYPDDPERVQERLALVWKTLRCEPGFRHEFL